MVLVRHSATSASIRADSARIVAGRYEPETPAIIECPRSSLWLASGSEPEEWCEGFGVRTASRLTARLGGFR